jgi:hypothetical protein
MTFTQFNASLKNATPPAGLAPALLALWWAGKDKWEDAHRIVMHEGGTDCAWVHAYLHRVEGDLENARYWYRQAHRSAAAGAAAGEWSDIARSLLDAS